MWKTIYNNEEVIGTYEELVALTKGFIANKIERV